MFRPLSQNFVVYHYTNVKAMKPQLGVWQLFEDPSAAATHTVAQGLQNALTGALPRRLLPVLPCPPMLPIISLFVIVIDSAEPISVLFFVLVCRKRIAGLIHSADCIGSA